MKHNELAQGVRACAMPRRDFLRNSVMFAVPLMASGSVFAGVTLSGALPATAAAYVPPTRIRGAAVVSVKSYGAVGDGIRDDTAAFQAAINALPASGGTVTVPAGTYLIDPVKKVNLRSSMLLNMDPNAILQAKTNSAIRAYILYAYKRTNVEIAGGRLIGDRETHGYISTSTSEWNHGIQILGCVGVTIRDLYVTKCAGDGITVGGNANDVVITNVVSTGNRRQGLSLTQCFNIKVYDSEFSYTNGTSPECGIDIEPDLPGTAYDIWIENCRLNNNAKYGMNIYKRSSNVTVTSCMVEYNGSCGVVTTGSSNINLLANTVRYNSATGIFIQDQTLNSSVSGGLSYGNYTRLGTRVRTPFTLTGWTSKIERDVLMRGTLTGTRVLTNNYQ